MLNRFVSVIKQSLSRAFLSTNLNKPYQFLSHENRESFQNNIFKLFFVIQTNKMNRTGATFSLVTIQAIHVFTVKRKSSVKQ